MKTIKRIVLVILIPVTIALLFRGWLYRHMVTYTSVGQRTNYLATDAKLVSYIETNSDSKKDTGIRGIIKLALSITSRQLHFTASQNDNDPNRLINSKAAHCVGYAAFFSTTCNYLLKKYKLDNTWIAKPQTGQLYFLGINIHKYFHAAFFKDHDFVIIENRLIGEILAVDPTVNDYFYIDFITCKPDENRRH